MPMMTTKSLVVGFAVMALLIAGCFIEYVWGDKRMAKNQRSNLIHTWLAAVLAGLILLFAIVGAHYAHARDVDGRFADSPLKPWFDGLRSKGGGPCCSDADGTALSDVDWDTKDGHYRVRLEGEWIDVPDDTVITEPNRAGRTMVWPMYLNGRPVVRCFMPGSMT